MSSNPAETVEARTERSRTQVVAVLALVVATTALAVYQALPATVTLFERTGAAMPVAFSAMGALLILRRRGGPIGAILMAGGLLTAVGLAAYVSALVSIAHHRGSILPLGFAAWLANVTIGAHLEFFLIGLLFLLFLTAD